MARLQLLLGLYFLPFLVRDTLAQCLKLPEHDVYFVHIPKNAGTTVIQQLKMQGIPGHYAITDKQLQCLEGKMDKTFAVIRNPYDRFISGYEYARMPKSYYHSLDGSTRYGKHQLYDVASSKSFTEFVRWGYLQQSKKHRNLLLSIHFTPQVHYITNEKGEVPIKLVRMETMERDLFDLFQVKVQFSALNPSNRSRDWRSYFDGHPEEQAMVYELYEEDFEALRMNPELSEAALKFLDSENKAKAVKLMSLFGSISPEKTLPVQASAPLQPNNSASNSNMNPDTDPYQNLPTVELTPRLKRKLEELTKVSTFEKLQNSPPFKDPLAIFLLSSACVACIVFVTKSSRSWPRTAKSKAAKS